MFLGGCGFLMRKNELKKLHYSQKIYMNLHKEKIKIRDMLQIQSYSVSWNNKSMNSTAVLKSKDGRLSLVAISPLGLTLFEAHFYNGILNFTKSSMIPDLFKPEMALFDIFLIYLPEQTLNETIQGGVVKDGPGGRSFYVDGQVEATIKYFPRREDAIVMEFKNFKRGYSYRIEVKKEEAHE